MWPISSPVSSESSIKILASVVVEISKLILGLTLYIMHHAACEALYPRCPFFRAVFVGLQLK